MLLVILLKELRMRVLKQTKFWPQKDARRGENLGRMECHTISMEQAGSKCNADADGSTQFLACYA